MKVLLDENIPHDLRAYLAHHDTYSVAYAGLSGMKNGALLDAAESAGFDVLVTGDKTLHFEQNLGSRKLALLSLSSANWPVIEPLVHRIVAALDGVTPGSFTRVECGTFSRRRQT